MELIDLYDRQKRRLNKTFDRWSGEPDEGEYKHTVHMWFLNSKGELLIQKRSEFKRRNAGKWSYTAGAVDSGETTLDGARREILEELGIELKEEQLDFIVSFKREHCFVDVWLVQMELDISKLKLQEEEVSEVKWVTIEELEELIKKEEFVKSISLYYDTLLNVLKTCYGVNN